VGLSLCGCRRGRALLHPGKQTLLEVRNPALAKAGTWRPLAEFIKPLEMTLAHSQQLCRFGLRQQLKWLRRGGVPVVSSYSCGFIPVSALWCAVCRHLTWRKVQKTGFSGNRNKPIKASFYFYSPV
jgi:hypothetical protein